MRRTIEALCATAAITVLGSAHHQGVNEPTSVVRRNGPLQQARGASDDRALSATLESQRTLTEGNLRLSLPIGNLSGIAIGFVLDSTEGKKSQEGTVTVDNREGNLVITITQNHQQRIYVHRFNTLQKKIGDLASYTTLVLSGDSFRLTNANNTRVDIDTGSVLRGLRTLIEHDRETCVTVILDPQAQASFTPGAEDSVVYATVTMINDLQVMSDRIHDFSRRIFGLTRPSVSHASETHEEVPSSGIVFEKMK